jgi:predicted outer membrane repeat protein
VLVNNSATFIMNGGTIYGNTSIVISDDPIGQGACGGVGVLSATFTLNSPATADSIHSNTAARGTHNVGKNGNGTINGTAGVTAGW